MEHPLPPGIFVEMKPSPDEFDNWTEEDFDREIKRLRERVRELKSQKVTRVDYEEVVLDPPDDDDDDIEEIIDDIGVLRKGSRGEGVKIMQEALGIGADGVFGPGTERALKEWQAANGLTADGVAGPATFGKLLED